MLTAGPIGSLGGASSLLRVNRAGKQPCADLGALIADGGEPRVNRRRVRRGNRDEAALVQLALFEVGEVESPIANHGAAYAGTVLSLCCREPCARQRIGCVE